MDCKKALALAVPIALFTLLGSSNAAANGKFKTHLSGFEEVPALSSPASGEFEAKVKGETIEYTLSYRGLESGVLFAHIHFGQAGVNGAVSVFLCSNGSGAAPGSPPECPSTSGSVSGVLDATDVIGPANQGIESGEIGELIEAIKAGVTYVNVHTTEFPSGEIRGQLGRGFGSR